MKVKELMELLSEVDPDANVRLMLQPRYPFEHGIRGIAIRSDFQEVEGSDLSGGDVFILEGGQLGYGNSDAFDNARKP